MGFSFTTGVWFGVALALAVIALLLQQLSKAGRPPASSSASSAGSAGGAAGSASGSAAADDEQEVEATDAAALEMLLRAASRPAFLGDAELYADEAGEEEGSVLLRGGELREAAVAALDGVLRRADAEQTASELATADPRCLVALLQQRLRGLRRALLAGEGPPHSAAIVDAAVALDDAAAAAAATAATATAAAARADAADVPAGGQDEEPTAEARAVASALATLHGALARLPPANRRLLARLLRHLHATAASARNDSDAARLGAAYADCVFAPGTARAPAAAAALVRRYSMLRAAFSLSKAQRQRFFGATSRASRDFLARQVAAEAAGGGAGAQQEQKQKQKQKQGGAAPAPAESAAWANAFAARWFGEFGASAALLRSLREDVQASLNSSAAQRPSFLLPVVARSVSLGASLPQLTNVALRPTDPAAPAPGELALSAELLYERGITFHLTVPVSVAGVTVPLAVRVQLQRLAGRLLLHLPAPHADRGAAWVAFEQPPQLELAVDLLYGEQQLRSELEGAGEQGQQGGGGSSLALATLPAIGDFIRNKVTSFTPSLARYPPRRRDAVRAPAHRSAAASPA
jgi:hypothetical protein